MINIVDKNRILIRYYREGEGKSGISRDLKISRKTVRKYIEEHEQLYGKDNAKAHIEKGLTSLGKEFGKKLFLDFTD